MVDPYKGNLGDIQVGGTTVGTGLIDGDFDFAKDLSEFYRQGGLGEPTAILQGHRSYRGRFTYAYIDSNAIIAASQGTALYSIIYYPKGTSGGNPKVTFTNAPLGGFSFRQEEDGVVRVENQEFAATAMSFGTV